MSKPQDPTGDTRQKILDAALRLFATSGFAGTSVRDIANAIGMSSSNIYHFFGSKEGIWTAIFESTVKDLPQTLRDAADRETDPLERFKLLIRAHIVFNNGYWREGRLFMTDEGRLSPESNDLVRGIQREVFDIYVAHLVSLRDRGHLRRSSHTGLQSLKVQALSVIGMVNWVVRWYQPRGPMTEEEVVEEMMALALRSVGIEDGERRADTVQPIRPLLRTVRKQ